MSPTVLALALQFVPGPAPAPPQPSTPPAPLTAYPSDAVNDARCIVTFARLVKAQQLPEAQAQIAVVYFTGKILGRDPNTDLKGLLGTADQTVGAAIGPDAQRCGTELQTSGARMDEAGKVLPYGAPLGGAGAAPPAKKK